MNTFYSFIAFIHDLLNALCFGNTSTYKGNDTHLGPQSPNNSPLSLII
ncbi:hypothetical protein AsAng_0000970 [Aureispira anguillae]|uniref:Uncharacterized protein n=1 Tax=Aureispira anguillae TaxID=2864201 RepID=A0A915VMN6_9BACT|nr:hypothetical protein AsAng_0000970 [Aureispira anguillae]